MNTYLNLNEKVSIVTGGSRSIGLAMAKRLANAGSDIVIVNRNASEGDEAVQYIRKNGGSAISISADVSKKDSVEGMIKKTIEHHGRIDVLVNCAGVIVRKPAIETTEADWDWTLSVNLRGLFFCCLAAGKQMIQQKKGKIINISSVAATFGLMNRAPYCASKAGVTQLTRALALEWAKYGICVNAIAPGIIRTSINEAYIKGDPERQKKMIQKIPLGRFGKPEDLEGITLFLASDASNYFTGQTLYVDGGYTIGCMDW
jgi:NAD(P)-dependent dehydrogenase (short-subunit alcohol dehydrogenase family)